jgi:sigma-B regulation protein RsbU (phosphoserine phosphatase)
MTLESVEPVLIAAMLAGLVILGIVVFGSRRRVGQLKRSSAEIHQEEQRVFDFLHGLGAAFSEGVPAGELHRLIVEGAQHILKADGGALYLTDKHGEILRPSFLSKGCPPLVEIPAGMDPLGMESFLRLHTVPVGKGLLGGAADWKEPHFLRRKGDLPPEFEDRGLGSLVIGPLHYRKQVLGVLALTRAADRDAFSDTKLELFKAIAEQSAFALFNQAIHLAAGEKHALDRDLAIAREIQQILLPSKAPHLEGFELGGLNLPARTLSGDYFDFLTVDDDHVGIAIADVSGKGVPASLIMAMCRGALRSQSRGELSPSAVLRGVNRLLYPDMKHDMFISMAYVILDRRDGSALLARAGHDAPLLYRSASGEAETMSPKGMAVGIDSGGVFDRACAEHPFVLEPGDLLLLYTDGITEALDATGSEFGLSRLRQELCGTAASGAGETLRHLANAVRMFSGDRPQLDDITLIALRKKPVS